MNGHRLKNAYDLDKVRTLMFAIYRAAGAKIRKVTEVLEIPLIDKLEYGPGINTRLLERIKQEKSKNV